MQQNPLIYSSYFLLLVQMEVSLENQAYILVYISLVMLLLYLS